MKIIPALLALLLLLLAAAQPAHTHDSLHDWNHSGTLAILTTKDGANLPASASVQDFPVLVRLSKETFDFRQAQPGGEDVRFSADGKLLAFQIETWDAVQGYAVIWVRIPVIQGNQRQLITMHWGRADAESQSNGAAVFNESNGYVVAMHLGDANSSVKDEVGTISPVDTGTTSCSGVIGLGRRFDFGKGINCGEKIIGLPAGSESNSTQAWIRAEQVNTTVVGWGNEQAQGKVVMQLRSPPHVRMDCYFSNADVATKGRLPMSQWVHLVHTYTQGESRVYVNGQLDGVTARKDSPLNIRTPARMWLGGWYGNYQFRGEIDEVRISKVARAADWILLEYENQKPLQTLVGTLVPPGNAFAVSQDKVTMDEGQNVTLTAKAGGAEKVHWLLTRDGKEEVVAVDTFQYTFDAGRIVGDAACTVRFRAVYPNEVKSPVVPITINEKIPEPRFTLQSPATWNGRDTVEVVPVFQNLDEMREARAGELRTRWSATGGAVIQQIASDRLILKRSQFSGALTVRAEIENGGTATSATTTIQVSEPTTDPWLSRAAEKNEKPEEGQFYARDETGEGTLYYSGTLDQPVDSVFLKVYADDKLYKNEVKKLADDKSYAFVVKLKPGLIKYRVEFGTKSGNEETILDRAGDLVCGDAYLINGQSNALATDTPEESPRESNEWIRSYGGPTGRGDGTAWVLDQDKAAKKMGQARPNLWCRPVWKRNAPEHQAELGWWGMELAKRLVASQKMPVFIINGAVGGTRIDEHQPTPDNHRDLNTIYGRTLWRIQQARMTHHIRAVIWHQGESDQGSDGPTGDWGWATYQKYFVEMSAAWKEDMPNIRHYYIYQIWPNACAMGGSAGSGDRLREAQRTLPKLYSNMSILSTHGIKPPGGCHYPLEGWSQLARMIQPLIEHDFYGKKPAESITPPNLRSVRYTTSARDEIALEFDQPVVWHDALIREFYLSDDSVESPVARSEKANEVSSGSAAGNVITLKLKSAQAATRITYLKERDWSQERLILGANGLAALTFCDAAISPSQN
jgi:Concanavalin A-like lectin/glucanases superfamily/Domain of unknown function (DUF2341)/Carbohydrate esterase, sialic acid-specific acetylesterase